MLNNECNNDNKLITQKFIAIDHKSIECIINNDNYLVIEIMEYFLIEILLK